MQFSMWWPCIASIHRWHVQLAIAQDTQVLASRAALLLVIPQSVPLLGAVLSLEQDFAFVFTELHEVPVGPLPQFVKVTVDGSTSISHIDCLPQFYEFAEDVSLLFPRLLMKIVNSTDPSISPTGTQFVTSCKLDCKPLTTVLWDQKDPSIQSAQQF